MTVVVIFLGLVGLVTQMLLPSWARFFDIEPNFPVLAVIYASFALRNRNVVIVCIVMGLCLDLLSPQRLGLSILSLGMVALLMFSQRRAIAAERWEYRMVLILAGTYFYLMIDYLLYSLQMQRWDWPATLWGRMLYPSLLNAVLGILLFSIANHLGAALGLIAPRSFTEEYART